MRFVGTMLYKVIRRIVRYNLYNNIETNEE